MNIVETFMSPNVWDRRASLLPLIFTHQCVFLETLSGYGLSLPPPFVLRFPADPPMPFPVIRPYQTVLQYMTVVWLIVAVGMVGANALTGRISADQAQLAPSAPIRTDDLLLIAAISGLIGVVSTVPGWTILIPPMASPESGPSEPTRTQTKENEGLSARELAIERLGHAFLAGMLIRITGTVALFLASSYYMDASPTRIGIWVLGWHFVLLLTEVVVLSRQIRVC